MKRTAYFEISSGISGDMLLGSLIDLGADVKLLDDVINELGLEKVHVEIEDKQQVVEGKRVKIRYKDQPHRKLSEILEMIDSSGLEEKIKELSIEAFRTLGEIESEIHNEPLEDLELHEVGMVDSIIDIVGSVALFHDLGIEEAYSSKVTLGSGYTVCEHGKLPVPVPATKRLLEGWKVDFSQKEGELVTPTGAVLLNVLTKQEKPPDLTLDKVGVGFGSREMEEPNVLRIFLGEKSNVGEEVNKLQFYVDDMTPEILSYALEKIRESALDVYSVPATGKKGRTGWEVTVISKKSSIQDVIDTIMKETSTLGLRIEDVRRVVSKRKIETVDTRWGEARVKVVPEQEIVSPEYESCRKIAEKNDVPLNEVYEEVRKRYEKEK